MPEHGQPLAVSDVLADELEAIKGPQRVSDVYGIEVSLRQALETNADLARQLEPRQNHQRDAVGRHHRRLLYTLAHRLNLSALCLSGGGIRSASLSLGVIQALVHHKLLDKFNYLSTVSGGGYIGSWLSVWLHQDDADAVLRALGAKRANPDGEAPQLRHLRQYSNYLTPTVGLFSGDTWTALVIILRNIFVNWLILIPALALLVIAIKLAALVLTAGGDDTAVFVEGDKHWVAVAVSLLCLIFGGTSLGYKLYRIYLPAEAVGKTKSSQVRFLVCSLLPVVLGGLCFVWLTLKEQLPADGLGITARVRDSLPASWGSGPIPFAAMVGFAFEVYLAALIVAFLWAMPFRLRKLPEDLRAKPLAAIGFKLLAVWSNFRATIVGKDRLFGIGGEDLLSWGAGAIAFATMAWISAKTIKELPPRIGVIGTLCNTGSGACTVSATDSPLVTISHDALAVIFGMPGFLSATLLAQAVYLLLRSGSRKGDVEREWLGRASSWHFIAAIGWIALATIVLLGPELYYDEAVLGPHAGKWLSALTAASGVATGFLGKSGLTPAQSEASGKAGISASFTLGIAGPLFAVLMLILLSVVVDWSVHGYGQQCFQANQKWDCRSWAWPVVFGIVAAVLTLADYFANINAFSIHALYRNRLVRAFLGGARSPYRHPDEFTRFDRKDDLRVASLWKRGTVPEGRAWRPFHVINMTLNLSVTKDLAWQERKAMPFSVTPLSCGNAELGYRPTDQYGGPSLPPPSASAQPSGGISLGTAMAISGAAVSPNMGYHSSRSLSFLLTFFNVRLGCWLGNPGRAGGKLPRWAPHWIKAPYRQEGPRLALIPLLKELFGLTSDNSPYVYLSDGGHFENLGLYEMVRRRCKLIIVCDADQDARRAYADLGNAVRKIWIDLGVRIDFPDSPLLATSASDASADIPYFALGTIYYVSDGDEQSETPKGKILYIKPVVRGDEVAADVIAYKRAHDDFPQQSTADQWFDESQLEAYRRLGYVMTDRIIGATALKAKVASDLHAIFDGLDGIDAKTMGLPAKPALAPLGNA